MCGVCTSIAGAVSIAASVSRTLTACTIVGKPCFLPSDTMSFSVSTSGPLRVVFSTTFK